MVTQPRQREVRKELTFIPAEDNDALSVYLREIGRRPLLSAEEEVRLAQQIEAGRAELAKPKVGRDQEVIDLGALAHRKFVESNLRLVVSQVRTYLNYSDTTLSFLDLCQEGNIGLLHALDKFDWRKGYKFSTIATWWIRQALGRAHHDQSRLVRLPVHMSEKLHRIKRATQQLADQLGMFPTNEEIATHLKLPLATVLDVLEHDYWAVSLDKPFSDAEDQSLATLLEERDPADLTERVASAQVADRVRAAIERAGLTERERQVIEWRYGLRDQRERTLEEVAKILKPKVTRERIRQIEARAFKKLRPLLERVLPDAVA
jgi:RNA polymerase primary sigma factor